MLPTSAAYKTAIVQGTRGTDANIFFGIYDVTAKEDAHPSAVDTMPFTDIQNIVDDERIASHRVGTLEEDYFRLDGRFKTAPEADIADYNLGWWTQSQSRLDRGFDTNPVISITFLNLHSSLGIELFFDMLGGSYCEAFKVVWYYNSTIRYQQIVEGNNNPRCYVDTIVENYNRLDIELMRTDKPFRYAKIVEVNFGGEKFFDNNNIVSARVTEEVDPVGGTLSINNLKFTVINENQQFNMINPDGVYGLLQKRQKIQAASLVRLENGDFETIPLGVYYLWDWKNATGLTASLEATDVIGLLDKTTYYSSPFWVNEPVENALNHILSDAGSFTLTVAVDIKTEVVNGYIPVCSHREALAFVLLACGASMRSTRTGGLEAFRPNYVTAQKDIDYHIVIGSPVISQKPLISSVEAKEYTYTLGSTAETIHESTFELNGTSTIVVTYDKPAADVTASVTGAGVIAGVPKYSTTAAILTITGTGTLTLTLTGKVYAESSRLVTASLPELLAGDIPQTATLADNKLIVKNGLAVAQRVLDYCQKRVKQVFDYWADPSVESGDTASVQTMFGGSQSGVVERQEITFAPNLKAKVEVTG